MDKKEFIIGAVKELEENNYEELRDRLVGEYLSFAFISDEEITRDFFLEKLFDYFVKLELKTGDTFEKMLYKYTSDWADIIDRRIPSEPQAKKNEPLPPVARSRKYYNHALEIKQSRQLTMKQLIDYSRIMFCLYIAIINNNYGVINDFEYDLESLDLNKIISSMKTERATGLIAIKKNKFDLTELYCTDTNTFIITMIMYYYIKNNEITGE